MVDPSTDDRELEARLSAGESLVLRLTKRRREVAKVIVGADRASVRTHICILRVL
jgi:hypothetical protein